MSKVKGSKITSKLAFVRDEYGKAALTDLIRSMEATDQESLRMVLDTSWYPMELYERVMRAICHTAASGDETVYTRIGYHSAEEVLNNTYKVFRGRNPVDLLNKMIPMHSMMNDPGEMEVISERDGQCTIRVLKPRSMPVICRVARAFYHRAVELCGGTAVQVSEVHCSGKGEDFCQFDIKWQTRTEA